MADEPKKTTDTPEYGCVTNPFPPAPAGTSKKGVDTAPPEKE